MLDWLFSTKPAVPYFGVDAPMPPVKEPLKAPEGPPPNMLSGGKKPTPSSPLQLAIDMSKGTGDFIGTPAPHLDYRMKPMPNPEVKSVKMGDVGLGLPDNVSTFLTDSDFRVNWETRNRFIFATLTFIGVLVALITCAILYNAVFQKEAVDDTTLKLIRTMLWTFTTAFMTIIGAMFFGKQFDVANFRKAASNVIQAAVSKPTI